MNKTTNVRFVSKSLASTLLFLLVAGLSPAAHAQTSAEAAKTSDAELAKELNNPVADLISVPLESRFDFGPGSTMRYTLNFQPVIPFELNNDWTLVSRTILPVVYAESPVPGGRNLTGIGDITQSFFFAPKKTFNDWIVGAGPVLRLPTASETDLGNGRWGAGPTAVVLRQQDAWTYGMLANHVWSFAGWGKTPVNMTYLQPFLAYTNDSLTTFGTGSEAGYDWQARHWTVPLDASVSQLVRISDMPVEFALGGRYYAERPAGGSDWGLKFTVTFMFPNK